MLVQGDPTTNILATRQIIEVWKNAFRFSAKRASNPVSDFDVPRSFHGIDTSRLD
jgi:hypothetical protein